MDGRVVFAQLGCLIWEFQKKRERLNFEEEGFLAMGVLNIGGHVEKVNGKELSYMDFVKNYMEKNQPVVLTGLMDDWRACKDWVCPDGQPNLHFFSTYFGESRVQVADCGSREFTDQKRVEMSVTDFISHWVEDTDEKHVDTSNAPTVGKSLLYLKDWHFVKEYPEYIAYTTPPFFRDDWLNLYLENYRMHVDPSAYQDNNDICCSDYRFVYMGTKGTWTPLHADVFRSYSWSANVCGKKQWHFLSPSQYHLVFDRNMKNSIYNIFEDVNESDFPGFRKSIWMECTQEQNEIIFVPSGWYHQVHNQEDTISINHNWFNAYNLSWVWELLLRDYYEAKGYIEDIKDICDDFESLCQRNLAANTGMNFVDFLIFVARFCFANVIQLCCIPEAHEISAFSPPINQQYSLNLVAIRKILLEMKLSNSFKGDGDNLLDFRATVKSREFLELCGLLHKTYDMIYEHHEQLHDSKNVSLDAFGNFNFIKRYSQVRSPEDLVNYIDSAFVELRNTFGED